MSEVINDALIDFSQTTVCHAWLRKYKNNVELSGWVIQKPKIIINAQGKKYVSFTLCQLKQRPNGDIYYDFFPLFSYAESVISKLEKQENRFFIVTLSQLIYNRQKKSSSPKIMMIEIPYELPEYPLLPPYEKSE